MAFKLLSITAIFFLALFAQAAVIKRLPEPDSSSLSNAKRMSLGLPLKPPVRRATDGELTNVNFCHLQIN